MEWRRKAIQRDEKIWVRGKHGHEFIFWMRNTAQVNVDGGFESRLKDEVTKFDTACRQLIGEGVSEDSNISMDVFFLVCNFALYPWLNL